MIDKLKQEGHLVVLKLKEHSAGITTVNTKMKYVRISRMWHREWRLLDKTGDYEIGRAHV